MRGSLPLNTPSDQVYDVAISFIAEDEPLASQLRDLLQPPLNVFVYSKRQEDLAGRDGIEVFRETFRHRSKLVVLLHRPKWGETVWTRVEETAIKELGMEQGWEHLMLVRVDKAAPVPKWIPKPHLYLDLTTFTLADLVGAIKARLVELGTELAPPSPAERAGAMAKKAEFDAETDRLLGGDPAVFTGAFRALCEGIAAMGKDVAGRTGWNVVTGEPYYIGGFMIAAKGTTLQLSAQQLWANTAREAYVEVAAFKVNWPIADGRSYGIRQDHIDGRVAVERLDIRRLPDLGWCWQIEERTHTTQGAAAHVVELLLDSIERDRRQ